MTDTTKEAVQEIFKSDMKTAERMNNLVDDHNREDISEATVEVAEELEENISNPQRKKYLYATFYQIGNSIGNEQIKEYAGKRLKALTSGHGQ